MIIKQQHYVWRHYLQPWASEGIIATFFKRSGKIIRSNLMGVGQERYFYRLAEFTDAEVNFLRSYIDRTSAKLIKALNFDFLNSFTSLGKVKKASDRSTKTAAEKGNDAEKIRELEINLMEHAHGKIEGLGMKLISCRSLEELKTIEKDDNLFEAIMFLCFQYFRTKNMRNLAIEEFKGSELEDLVDKSWNILAYLQATNLAESISLDPKLKFLFYENISENNFITGDQPIFNILSDKINKNGEVIALEFYYPLSPKHALAIHFRDEQKEKFAAVQADQQRVDFLNSKVISNADFYLFAETVEQLQQLRLAGAFD